jgi:hypothetical protein
VLRPKNINPAIGHVLMWCSELSNNAGSTDEFLRKVIYGQTWPVLVSPGLNSPGPQRETSQSPSATAASVS